MASLPYDRYAVKGQDFYDPEADSEFVKELKFNLPDNFEIIERDLDIEDPDFIREAVDRLLDLIEKMKGRK